MKEFVCLRGLVNDNKFITIPSSDETPETIVRLADGTIAYELLAEYDTIEECQVFLYGRSSTGR